MLRRAADIRKGTYGECHVLYASSVFMLGKQIWYSSVRRLEKRLEKLREEAKKQKNVREGEAKRQQGEDVLHVHVGNEIVAPRDDTPLESGDDAKKGNGVRRGLTNKRIMKEEVNDSASLKEFRDEMEVACGQVYEANPNPNPNPNPNRSWLVVTSTRLCSSEPVVSENRAN